MKICGKGRLSCARVARKCRHSDKQFPCDCRLALAQATEWGESKKDAEKSTTGDSSVRCASRCHGISNVGDTSAKISARYETA